ncbi:MAG: DUF120 domain-containing protein [Candidatus Micrarchaeota archaeon]
MDEVLLFLLKSGAAKAPAAITTGELGSALGMTQQNASRRLQQLEQQGLVSRSSDGIMVTSTGIKDARKVYAIMKEAFEGSVKQVRGSVVSGLGEGRFYLSIPEYQQMLKNLLGFVPYAGTLNLKLDESELWKKDAVLLRAVATPGFTSGSRKYGGALIRPCTIGGKKAAIVFPERTHHPENIIEVIAEVNLREALRKKDGDEAVLKLEGQL